MPTVTVNGVSLFYLERGEGEPVVMVHGGLGDYRDWGALVSDCAGRYRAVAYSRRNAHPNRNLPEDVPSRVVDHADDLAGLILGLGAAPAHIVGDSYGAAVALQCALHRPDIVGTLILDEPPVPSLLESQPDGPSLRREFSDLVDGRVRRGLESGEVESAVRTLVDYLEGGEGAWDRIPPATRVELLENSMALRRELRGGFLDLARDDLKGLQVPVLLIRGDQGPDVLHRCTEVLAAAIPGSRLVTLSGLTHGALPQSQAYRETVAHFLEGHRRIRSPG